MKKLFTPIDMDRCRGKMWLSGQFLVMENHKAVF